jgi:peptide/nickel transport system permease protein
VITLILRRLAGLAGVLFIVSVLVFFGARLFVRGDLALVIVGAEGTPEAFELMREQLGLNRPVVVQYFDWLFHALTGDFGTSPLTGRSVAEELASQVPVSLELTVLVLFISIVIGGPIGILSAVSKRKRLAGILQTTLLVVFSVPVFVIGIVLVLLAAFYAPALYSAGYTPIHEDFAENMRSMFLPALTMGVPTAAITMQMTRSAMLDALNAPHIDFANARGLPVRRVRYIHALKSALPPILTLQGFQFGIVFGGLLIVEEVFSLPGIGRGILLSIESRDVILLTAQVLVLCAVFVIINAIVDIVQPLLDPRQVSS